MNKLALRILNNNRLFSVSLLAIYVIISVIFVIITFFYSSVTASVTGFLEEYGIADATVLVNYAPEQITELVEETEGVLASESFMMLEGKTTLEGGNAFTARYISIPGSSDSSDAGTLKYYNTETGRDVETDEDSVLISAKFAEKNNIEPGDSLTVSLSGKDTVLSVTATISCPETIYVARDVNSWFDDTQYAFIYVSERIMQESFGTNGARNRFDIWFEDDADADAVLTSVCDRLGEQGITVASATLLEDSAIYYQIHSALDGAKGVLSYLPVIIFITGVLFSGFFVYQIIISSEKNVGILQALGAGSGRVCLIFIKYNLILCTAAIIIGGALGVLSLRFLLQIYKDTFGLADIIISCKWYRIPLAIATLYAISVLSCIICVRLISRFDPAVIVSGDAGRSITGMPAFISRLHINAYAKISVSALFRDKRRIAVICLCNLACMLLTFMSVAVLVSKITGMNFTFEERFGYNYIVISNDTQGLAQAAALEEVNACEYAATCVLDYEDEFMRIEALPSSSGLTTILSTDGEELSVPEDGIILEEGFARRHGFSVGDAIEVSGASFTVTAISREYFYSAQYISLESAALLGLSGPNVLYVNVSSSDSDNFKNALAAIDGIECFYSVESRRESATASMGAIDVPCYFFVALGILIGAIIVSNMNILTINRKKKEYATLTILGTSGGQFTCMFLFDIFAQFIITSLVGIPISYLASQVILRGMSSISMEYVLANVPLTAAISAGALLIHLLFGLAASKRTIRRLNYVEVLAKR